MLCIQQNLQQRNTSRNTSLVNSEWIQSGSCKHRCLCCPHQQEGRVSRNSSKGLDVWPSHDSSYDCQPFPFLTPSTSSAVMIRPSTGHVQSYIAYVCLFVCFVIYFLLVEAYGGQSEMKNDLANQLDQFHCLWYGQSKPNHKLLFVEPNFKGLHSFACRYLHKSPLLRHPPPPPPHPQIQHV